MMKSIITAIFLVICISKIDSENSDNLTGKNVVCYYTNWSPHRAGRAQFSPHLIDPFLCTDIVYAFATFTDDKLTPSDADEDIAKGGYKKINDLKHTNKKLRTSLSIGGTAEGPLTFRHIVNSKSKTDTFIRSAILLLRKYNFDGLNLDWHYPGDKVDDKDNYVSFIKTLKEEFEKEAAYTNRSRLLISMSIPSKLTIVEKGYDLQNLQKYVDYFNLLGYDYHELLKKKVSHHAPLFTQRLAHNSSLDEKLSVSLSIQNLLDRGITKKKLNLGIPTYGRVFKLKESDNHEPGAPSKDADNDEVGFKPYFDICKTLKDDPTWTVVQLNETASGPYAFKGESWMSFDDENIARRKGAYARNQGLGGIMFWTVDDDDFNGDCGKGTFPLIKAAKQGLLMLQ